jgi:alpha-glucoside transport system substrate-binding protein
VTLQRPADARRSRLRLALAVGVALTGLACSTVDEQDPEARTVTVFGPWRAAAADAFRASMEPFEARTGIDVVYTGSGSFAADATRRLEDGQPPDVVVFPQPGLMTDLAERGYLLPLQTDVASIAQANHADQLAEATARGTAQTGVVYRLNVKSLVWYQPQVFAEAGYEVPQTMTQLQELAARMAADGTPPWCIGVEAFQASGWPATDWVEDLLLRLQPPDVYDAWVAGETPFTDEAIADTFSTLEDLVLTPGRAFGGRRTILNTAVGEAQAPMFTDPPGCLMYRQASFQRDNLDPSIAIGPDGDTDVFVLPTDAGGQPPLLIGGTFAAAATDTTETWDLLAYLATPEGSSAWLERGGFISPHRDVEPQDYADDFDAQVAELLHTASTVRFDGSDLMEPAVGTGTFLDAMVRYIATGRLSESLTLAQSGYDE